jgi:glycosyltransferase involved in cell wall biosynthesis
MSDTPRVSIGLPVYNGEKFLAASIDSLLGQTYQDFELIISDNASTDGTADICRQYEKQDPRIRYFRQEHNIGAAPNYNFVINEARGELFKHASHDDLYGRDLLARCVAALDENEKIVLAHSWSAIIDENGTVVKVVNYPVNTAAAEATERFRSMLFDGWGDDEGGVVRTAVLRRTPLHGSYHFSDRTFIAEIGLHGPFHMVPEYLYFRRHHPEQAGKVPSVRGRCARMDPRRANRLRHPSARLYAEYIWGYLSAIHRAPLPAEEKRQCYQLLAHWTAGRAMPVAVRTMRRSGLDDRESVAAPPPGLSVETVVARGRQGIPWQ